MSYPTSRSSSMRHLGSSRGYNATAANTSFSPSNSSSLCSSSKTRTASSDSLTNTWSASRLRIDPRVSSYYSMPSATATAPAPAPALGVDSNPVQIPEIGLCSSHGYNATAATTSFSPSNSSSLRTHRITAAPDPSSKTRTVSSDSLSNTRSTSRVRIDPRLSSCCSTPSATVTATTPALVVDSNPKLRVQIKEIHIYNANFAPPVERPLDLTEWAAKILCNAIKVFTG